MATRRCLAWGMAYDRAGRPHRTWRFLRDSHWTEVRVAATAVSLARQWGLSGTGILLKSPIERKRLGTPS